MKPNDSTKALALLTIQSILDGLNVPVGKIEPMSKEWRALWEIGQIVNRFLMPKEPSYHHYRVCLHCGHGWWGLHCPHDGYQNSCPSCNKKPTPVVEPPTGCDCPLVEEVTQDDYGWSGRESEKDH